MLRRAVQVIIETKSKVVPYPGGGREVVNPPSEPKAEEEKTA